MYKQGKALRIALVKKNITQIRLAKLINMPKQAISDFACERRRMTLEHTKRVCESLDMKLSEFIALGEE